MPINTTVAGKIRLTPRCFRRKTVYPLFHFTLRVQLSSINMYNGAAHPALLVDRTCNSPPQTLLLVLLPGFVQGFYLRKINQKAVSIKTQIADCVVVFVLSSAVASQKLDFSWEIQGSREWNAQNSCCFWVIPTISIPSSIRLRKQQSAAQKLQRLNWHLTKDKQGGDHGLPRHCWLLLLDKSTNQNQGVFVCCILQIKIITGGGNNKSPDSFFLFVSPSFSS